jgi:hypothetical protein
MLDRSSHVDHRRDSTEFRLLRVILWPANAVWGRRPVVCQSRWTARDAGSSVTRGGSSGQISVSGRPHHRRARQCSLTVTPVAQLSVEPRFRGKSRAENLYGPNPQRVPNRESISVSVIRVKSTKRTRETCARFGFYTDRTRDLRSTFMWLMSGSMSSRYRRPSP